MHEQRCTMHAPMRALLLTGLLLLAGALQAQVRVKARVTDAATGEPLPYCAVVLTGGGASTLTNEEGWFELNARSPDDTVRMATLGYASVRVRVGDLALGTATVRLRPSDIELRPLEVTRNDRVYRLLAECGKRLRKHRPYRSKLYFGLGTHCAGREVEMVEAFYNARFDGARIEALDLKNGRIAIAPVDQRYFVNLNTSKAIMRLDVAQANGAFPATPFQGSAKEVRRAFDVTLEGVQPGEAPLYRIRFAPRVEDGTCFSGTSWLDTATLAPRRIELHCTDCHVHPFRPLWEGPQLDSVQLHVTKDFVSVDGSPQLDLVTLDYTLRYRSERRNDVVHSTGVMHPFDRGGAFVLPLFDYDAQQDDYRKITFLPYDSAFWAEAPQLLRTEQQQRALDFLRTNGQLLGHGLELPRHAKFFESNYAFWSAERRIGIKYSFPQRTYDGQGVVTKYGTAPDAVKVELVAQLYLAMDPVGDSLRFHSATVFDGFRSYWLIPGEAETDCYLNLFFDLCEMERRRMAERLQGVTDVEVARRIHAECTRDMERTTERYRRGTALGRDRKALARWNAVVNDALHLDNMKLFGLEAPR